MQEEIEKFKAELREQGLHHASKDFKDKVAEFESELEKKQKEKELEAKVLSDFSVIDTVKPKEKEEKPKQKVIVKRERKQYDPNKTYLFKMVKPTARWVVPREARVWDKEENRYREIRYNRLADSPYVDEQDEFMPTERVAPSFVNGQLRVSGKDTALIEYLQLLDDYKPNGKPYSPYHFILDDPDARIKAQSDHDDLVLEAKMVISKAVRENPDKLKDFIRGRFNYGGKSVEELKVYANKKAELHPKDFIEDFNNPKHKIKSDIVRAREKGLFDVNAGRVKIIKTGKVVFTFDPSLRVEDELTKWVANGSQEAKDFKALVDGTL